MTGGGVSEFRYLVHLLFATAERAGVPSHSFQFAIHVSLCGPPGKFHCHQNMQGLLDLRIQSGFRLFTLSVPADIVTLYTAGDF